MSRLSKAAKKIPLGVIVKKLVLLAEEWLGARMGAEKRRLAVNGAMSISKTLAGAGVTVAGGESPVVVGELVDHTVGIYNETGAFEHGAEGASAPVLPAEPALATSDKPIRRRAKRVAAVATVAPATTKTGTLDAELVDETDAEDSDSDLDDILADFDIDDDE